MAGMPPWSVPAGTVSGLKGLDLSPWFQNEQLNFQRQMAAQQLAQQNQAAIAAEQSQKAMQAYRERMGMLELKAAGEQATQARKDRLDAMALRERDNTAERDLRMQELAFKERASERALSQDQTMQDRALTAKKEAMDFTARQQEQDKADLLSMTDAKARARAAVVARATQVARQSDGNPETVRDMLLQETLTPDMAPNDRIAAQEAIGEWYKDAVAATKRKAVDAEEANRAKETQIRLKLTEGELERKKKQDEFDAAAKRAAPLVREREALNKRTATIDNQIVALTAAVASAPNDAVRVQRANMLAQYQQAKADLERAIAQKDAEINQIMGLEAGPQSNAGTGGFYKKPEPLPTKDEIRQTWEKRFSGTKTASATEAPSAKQDTPAIAELKRQLELARKSGNQQKIAYITSLLEGA